MCAFSVPLGAGTDRHLRPKALNTKALNNKGCSYVHVINVVIKIFDVMSLVLVPMVFTHDALQAC